MLVREATPLDVAYVAHHLRAADRIEQFATRFSENPDELAGDFIATMERVGIGTLAYCTDDGVARAVATTALVGPELGRFWQMNAEGVDEIMREGSLFARRNLVNLWDASFRRLEAVILAASGNQRWARFFGFTIEGTLRRYGKNGEDFVIMARIRK